MSESCALIVASIPPRQSPPACMWMSDDGFGLPHYALYDSARRIVTSSLVDMRYRIVSKGKRSDGMQFATGNSTAARLLSARNIFGTGDSP